MPTWSSPSRITPVGVTERAIGCSRAAGAVVAHYRLAYILEKTELGEPVCRACFWPGWYDDCHKTRAEVIQKHLDEGYDLDFLLDSGFAPRRP